MKPPTHPRLINASFALRALKVVLALLLGVPATLLWMPYMVPFALVGPFLLVRDALAGQVNVADLWMICVAICGTAGLAGFWLWVFDHPGRPARVQRGIGVLWLAGAIALWAYIRTSHDSSRTLFIAITAAVVLTGLAMSIRPRRNA